MPTVRRHRRTGADPPRRGARTSVSLDEAARTRHLSGAARSYVVAACPAGCTDPAVPSLAVERREEYSFDDRLPTGAELLGSRRGNTSRQANPWTAVDDGTATETDGLVYSNNLAWSGSWRVQIRRSAQGRVSITGGTGQEGLHWALRPGKTWTTPVYSGLLRAARAAAAASTRASCGTSTRSDNTDAGDRVNIQYGFGQAYPARAMGTRTTDEPSGFNHRTTSLRFRFQVAAAHVAAYKELRPVVQHGAQYRLGDPEREALTGVQYVRDDRIALLAFKTPWRCNRPPAPLRPEGIAADSRRLDEDTGETHWGATLNALGLPLRWAGADWDSAIPRLRRVP